MPVQDLVHERFERQCRLVGIDRGRRSLDATTAHEHLAHARDYPTHASA